MKPAFEDMNLQIPAVTAEPEDYTGEDGLLYCGKCRTPKEAYFPADKATLFGRDRHPAECDCQRAQRMSVKPPNSAKAPGQGGRTETPGLYRPGYAGMDFCQ